MWTNINGGGRGRGAGCGSGTAIGGGATEGCWKNERPNHPATISTTRPSNRTRGVLLRACSGKEEAGSSLSAFTLSPSSQWSSSVSSPIIVGPCCSASPIILTFSDGPVFEKD